MSPQDKARAGHLRRKYGITEEQYNELLTAQEHSCGVCAKHESSFTVRLAVDHNHRTGEIRGLLCRYCNHRLVGRHTDSKLVHRIADYLDYATGWFVPPKKKRRRKTTRKVKTIDKGKTTRRH